MMIPAVKEGNRTMKYGEMFIKDIRERLGEKLNEQILELLKEAKGSITQRQQQHTTTTENVLKILQCDTDLRNRYVELCDKSILEVKVIWNEMKRIPTTPPRRFTTDILLSVVPFLPYPSLGGLKTTCKWMYGNITKDHEKRARAKGKQGFGLVEVVTGGGGMWNIKHMYRIRSLKEEFMEIGRFNATSKIIVVKFQGTMFLGTVVSYGNNAIQRLFETMLSFHEPGTSRVPHDHKQIIHFVIKSKHPA